MNASRHLKSLLAAAAAVAVIGTAMAQGNPPNPAVRSAPVGAGQQSTQNTPMGTTGTPTGGSAATGTTSNSSSTNMGTASSSTTGSGTSMGSSSTSADTSMTPALKTHRAHHMKRAARADRN